MIVYVCNGINEPFAKVIQWIIIGCTAGVFLCTAIINRFDRIAEQMLDDDIRRHGFDNVRSKLIVEISALEDAIDDGDGRLEVHHALYLKRCELEKVSRKMREQQESEE